MKEKNRKEMERKDAQLKELLSKTEEDKPQPTMIMGDKDADLVEKESKMLDITSKIERTSKFVSLRKQISVTGKLA